MAPVRSAVVGNNSNNLRILCFVVLLAIYAASTYIYDFLLMVRAVEDEIKMSERSLNIV
jgi:hypothetical protein